MVMAYSYSRKSIWHCVFPGSPRQMDMPASMATAVTASGHLEQKKNNLQLSLGLRYCTVLYCTVLYCTVLYCTVQHSRQITESTVMAYRVRSWLTVICEKVYGTAYSQAVLDKWTCLHPW